MLQKKKKNIENVRTQTGKESPWEGENELGTISLIRDRRSDIGVQGGVERTYRFAAAACLARGLALQGSCREH